MKNEKLKKRKKHGNQHDSPKIDPRVSELADPEIWHLPLTSLVVLATLTLL